MNEQHDVSTLPLKVPKLNAKKDIANPLYDHYSSQRTR